jgi:hypothetical protein
MLRPYNYDVQASSESHKGIVKKISNEEERKGVQHEVARFKKE